MLPMRWAWAKAVSRTRRSRAVIGGLIFATIAPCCSCPWSSHRPWPQKNTTDHTPAATPDALAERPMLDTSPHDAATEPTRRTQARQASGGLKLAGLIAVIVALAIVVLGLMSR